ncbi:hypothetical protein ACGF3K_14670 [Streptomyces sp. NPDC047980]|uniref:hypothetical protein n=1 Tax=Streptomyces sp. NPDC047980 TaxID=3365494 RepID=UPI003719102D
MAHRPYPNVDRALNELARKESPTRRSYTTLAGQLAEDYEFPGQSLAVMAAQLRASAGRALEALNVIQISTVSRA